MQKKSPIAVLLSIDDPGLAAKVWDALAGPPVHFDVHEFHKLSADAPEIASADVIAIGAGDELRLSKPLARRVARGEAALLAIGRACAAGHDDAESETERPRGSKDTRAELKPHVVLPADASPREIALACQLLAENVRLRQRLRATRRHRGRLARLAETDPLTGLANRRGWQRELVARLRHAEPDHAAQCLAIIDLDYFKRVNDVHGYAAGDRVLIAVGAALRQAVRTGDFVARLGGDEFGLLLAGIDWQSAAAIVERVRERIASEPPRAAEVITASAGYVIFDRERDLDAASLVAAADAALREAKSEGRDRAQAAPASQQSSAARAAQRG